MGNTPKPEQKARNLAVRRARDKPAARRRALATYYRKKKEGTLTKPKPITGAKRAEYNTNRREKSAHKRAVASKHHAAERQRFIGLIIVGKTTAQIDHTRWEGPGQVTEQELTKQADAFLRSKGWTPELRRRCLKPKP